MIASLLFGFTAGVVAAWGHTALQASDDGAGPIRGAVAGGAFLVACCPLLTTLAVALVVARATETGLAQCDFTLGVSQRKQLIASAIYGFIIAMLAIPAAAAGGALSGLGDSLRQGSGLLGVAIPDQRSIGLLLLSGGSSILGCALGVLCRRQSLAAVVVLGVVVAFFPVASAGRFTWLADLTQLCPVAPTWSLLRLEGVFAFDMSGWMQVLVSGVWIALGLVVCKRRSIFAL